MEPSSLAVDQNFAAVDAAKPEDGLQNLGAAAADQTGQPMDFALEKREFDIAQPVIGNIGEVRTGSRERGLMPQTPVVAARRLSLSAGAPESLCGSAR